MIKAASIGLGWWSDELAKSIQGKSKKIKIVSCYSRSKKKRINFSKKYKINYHDSYTAIINDPNIDAVILTTPHSLHSKHAIQAMKNGKHVFVEKPMATKYQDAKKMFKVAKKYKKILSVGHNRRYSSVSDFIYNLNRQKKIGKILHIEANYSAPGALKYKKKYWRASRKESPGGAVSALGIHMIDLMCYFGGTVKSVQSLVKKFAVKVNMDDTTSAIFEFSKNCTGNLTTIFACPYTTTFNVFGTNMNIFSDVDNNKIKIFHKNGRIENPKLKNKDTLLLELQEFADCCKKKKKYRIKNIEAAHNVKIMEAIVESSKKNKKLFLV
jgi:predicted dehydrogenase